MFVKFTYKMHQFSPKLLHFPQMGGGSPMQGFASMVLALRLLALTCRAKKSPVGPETFYTYRSYGPATFSTEFPTLVTMPSSHLNHQVR